MNKDVYISPVLSDVCFYGSARPDRRAQALWFLPVSLCILFICSSVAKLVNVTV